MKLNFHGIPHFSVKQSRLFNGQDLSPRFPWEPVAGEGSLEVVIIDDSPKSMAEELDKAIVQ